MSCNDAMLYLVALMTLSVSVLLASGMLVPMPHAPMHQAANTPPPIDARAFIRTAARECKAGLQLARLGVEKATSKEIRAFARDMIDLHRKAHRRLSRLAALHDVRDPSGPGMAKELTRRRLTALQGEEFDGAFMRQVAFDYRVIIDLFERAQTVEDPNVRWFVCEILPSLHQHGQRTEHLAN